MAIYDLRIERHVIGGLIKNPACFPDAERWVNGKDFYHDGRGAAMNQETFIDFVTEKRKVDHNYTLC